MRSPVRPHVTPALHGRRTLRARRSGPDRDPWPGLVSEHGGGYHVGRPADDADAGEVPFGSPVLAELPDLAHLLQQLTVADEALLDAVAGLAGLLASDEVERATGVGLEHWLALTAGVTRMDRRLLVRACRLMHRLPTLDAAVRGHRVSFAQLRGLTIALRSAPRRIDGALDDVLAALLDGLDGLERPDPDALVRQVTDAVDELDADDLTAREDGAAAGRFLQLQPRLDATGGRLVGELDAAGLALLDAATTPTAEQADAAGSHGAARAELLLARLAGSGTTPEDRVAGGPTDGEWHERLPPPQLLLRLPFDALVDDRVPGDLLTTLVGGRLRVTSAAARRLADRAGARLRAIVVDDDGTVLGVGRTTRRPPGWLADVLPAIHDTCTGPGCDRPARGGEIDHAVPWWPTGSDRPPGETDLDNLGPLCATTNRDKEAAGWQATQAVAGTRTWTHPRSGLTTTTVPATWRPPGDPRRRRRRPPRPGPPGHPGTGPPDASPEPPDPPGGPDGPVGLPF